MSGIHAVRPRGRRSGREARASAAVLVAPGRVELERVARRAPGTGEVEIAVEGCGVCGSNVPVWRGRPWFDYPRPTGSPGHEGWGEVVRLGEGVRALRAGQRVAFLSETAFAEYDTVPAESVVPLHRVLDGLPFPGEALGCAANVMRRADVLAGDVVAVVGVGFLGAVIVQAAARAGACVIAVSRRPYALEMARALGAAAAIPLNGEERTVAAVAEVAGEDLCDVVIEAAGAQQTLDLSSELVRERGRLVIAGYHQDGLRQVNLQLWNWRGIDVVNAHERARAVYVQGIREAADQVAGGLWDVGPLLTHVFPLSRLGDALDAATTRPDGFMKALVMP